MKSLSKPGACQINIHTQELQQFEEVGALAWTSTTLMKLVLVTAIEEERNIRIDHVHESLNLALQKSLLDVAISNQRFEKAD
jgi:hypothetical protein